MTYPKVKLHIILIAVCTIMFLCLFIPEKAAALLVKKDLGTLTAETDLVLTGKVTGMQAQWEDNKIYTYVTISAKNFLKGDRKTEVTVKVPGGTVGDVACFVTGTPRFKKGEEVFLFLKAKNNYFNLVGGYRGKYTIKKNKVLGPNLTVSEFTALVFSKMEAAQKSEKGTSNPALRRMSPEVFSVPKNEAKAANNSSHSQDIALSGGGSGGGGSSPQSSWVTILQEDFNSGWPSADPKWDRGGSPGCGYTWDEDPFKPHGGSYSAWCAGESLGGCPDLNPATNNYPNNMNAWMVYGPFDLSDATSARMSFYHWTRTKLDYDKFFYGASTDGNNFKGYSLSGDYTPWEQEELSLDEYCGNSSVWVGFAFTSDSAITDKGAFIDEVVIEKYTGPRPEITNVVPGFGPAKAKNLATYEAAGDSTQVIINGCNFGATPGEVVFWAGQGDSEYTFATIESWSENQIVCLVPGGASSYYWGDGLGNVFVRTSDDLLSDPALFRVTYSYGGGKWAENKLTYKINPNTADCPNEEIAVQAAADTWNSTRANFNFEYGGFTGKTGVGKDGENSVIWVNEGETDWLAETWTYLNPSNPKIILENDLEFSDYYPWSAGASCPPGYLDVQNTATHEFGHWLMLLDLYGTADSEKTMFGFGGPGETKARTLEPDDIDGIRYIYGLFPQGASLKGVVKLEKVNPGEPDSPDANHSGTEIKVIQQGSLVKSSFSAQDGSYLIDGLAAGVVYDVHYCRPGWSKVERNNIAFSANETKELPPLVLVVGDMNQDTEINILDLLWMAAKMGLTPGDSGWGGAKIADVNRDNAINILDLLRVAKNISIKP